jgi:hypothetical protein
MLIGRKMGDGNTLLGGRGVAAGETGRCLSAANGEHLIYPDIEKTLIAAQTCLAFKRLNVSLRVGTSNILT